MNAINYSLRAEARPPRMAQLSRLPVFFALTDKRAVVAGGSAAAAWKAELLSAAGAQVDVYAVAPCEELAALAYDPPGGAIRIVRRSWAADDFADAALAVGAFDDDTSAAAFAAAVKTAAKPALMHRLVVAGRLSINASFTKRQRTERPRLCRRDRGEVRRSILLNANSKL